MLDVYVSIAKKGFHLRKGKDSSVVSWFPRTYGGGRNLVKHRHLRQPTMVYQWLM